MRFNTNQDFHVVVADIKNFKWINGTYGEKTGDQVLTYLGDTYRNQVRYGTVGRYGETSLSHHIWKERDPYGRYGEIYPQGREWSTDS